MGKACFDESKMRNFLLLTLGHKYHRLTGMKEKHLTYPLYVMDVTIGGTHAFVGQYVIRNQMYI